MPDTLQATFICPACGEGELPVPEGVDPQETPYLELAEIHDCEQAQTARFIYGNGYTRGFGGVVRDTGPGGEARERFVPPRAPVAYHFSRRSERVGHAEAAPGFYLQPLFRNLKTVAGVENVFTAVVFLPHGEAMTPQMRARGEALAKALG